MHPKLTKAWKALPEQFRRELHTKLLSRTGIYFLSRSRNSQRYNRDPANFAGNIQQVKDTYIAEKRGSNEVNQNTERRFLEISDSLVMKNGVTRSTFKGRSSQIVSSVLNKYMLDKREISVLDIPSSTGSASLGIREEIEKRYAVGSYILADLCFDIYYDKKRECVFDDEGNLLQVKFKRRFVTINRAHRCGLEHTRFVGIVLFPAQVWSWFLKKKYKFTGFDRYQHIRLTHPDVDALLDDKHFELKKLDVFKPIEGKFDLIISFNLLMRRYFDDTLIKLGIQNLGRALNEGGLLVIGEDLGVTFSVFTSRGGQLMEIGRETQRPDHWLLYQP